jgi:alkylmercury lyase
MQHGVAVSAALITGPPIPLLDEPTIGLDVEAARTFKDCIEAAKSRTPSIHNRPKGQTAMNNIEHDNDVGLADFLAGHGRINTDEIEYMVPSFALIGLTNFGERPVSLTRLAEVWGRPVREAEALALICRKLGWPPGTWVENGLVTVNPEREPLSPRRQLQIGDRRFGVSGCAPDVFLYAPLVRPSLQLEETCPVTRMPIRVVFTPSGVESVDPEGAVLPVPHPQVIDRIVEMGADCNTNEPGGLCSQCPFYASAEAARGWLADHPGGRVFPVREAWNLSFYRDWRDRMSAILNLDARSQAGTAPRSLTS